MIIQLCRCEYLKICSFSTMFLTPSFCVYQYIACFCFRQISARIHQPQHQINSPFNAYFCGYALGIAVSLPGYMHSPSACTVSGFIVCSANPHRERPLDVCHRFLWRYNLLCKRTNIFVSHRERIFDMDTSYSSHWTQIKDIRWYHSISKWTREGFLVSRTEAWCLPIYRCAKVYLPALHYISPSNFR